MCYIFVHIYLASRRGQISYYELGRAEEMKSVSLEFIPWLGETDI